MLHQKMEYSLQGFDVFIMLFFCSTVVTECKEYAYGI